MFEGDLTTLSTPDLLESAAEHRAEANRVDARLLEHAQTYADRYHPDRCPTRPGRSRGLGDGRERAIVLGGDGCPAIAEFAPAEFGAMIGLSPGAAADLIGQALALRHRLPLTWARVQAGEATPWKARKIATACLDLSEESARSVDQRVAKVVDSLTPIRLDKIVEAAKKHADPDGARRKADEKARERGVYVGRSDEHGTKKIFIRTGTGHAIRFDARLTSIAEALKILGDTASLQRRRADAVGIIADPRYTEELLHQARLFQTTHPAPPETQAVPDTGCGGQPADAATGGQPADRITGASTDDGGPRAAAAAVTGRDTTPGGRATRRPSAASATASTADEATEATTDQSAAPTGRRGSAPASGQVADGGKASTTEPASAWTKASTTEPARGPEPVCGPDRSRRAGGDADHAANTTPQPNRPHPAGDEDLLKDWSEPGPDDEADRDAPHPSETDHPDPLDTPYEDVVEPFDPGLRLDLDDGEPLDTKARRALDARLAQIRHDAHTRPSASAAASASASDTVSPRTVRRLRPGQTEIYVHLTDHTLVTGTGVVRAEDIGPLIASQLSELIGHGAYTVKPVIDLNDAVSVDAYEIPDRIRERVKLQHPVEVFPYGTRETHPAMDLDHIQPYEPTGPPGQTTPANLAPLRRFPHRVKTHGRWKVRRLDRLTLEWITPNGFAFHVDPTGTHRIPNPLPNT